MKSESFKNLPSLTQTICLLNLSSTKRSQHMPGKLPSSAHTHVYMIEIEVKDQVILDQSFV